MDFISISVTGTDINNIFIFIKTQKLRISLNEKEIGSISILADSWSKKENLNFLKC
jgi:hypothetical protein